MALPTSPGKVSRMGLPALRRQAARPLNTAIKSLRTRFPRLMPASGRTSVLVPWAFSPHATPNPSYHREKPRERRSSGRSPFYMFDYCHLVAMWQTPNSPPSPKTPLSQFLRKKQRKELLFQPPEVLKLRSKITRSFSILRKFA